MAEGSEGSQACDLGTRDGPEGVVRGLEGLSAELSEEERSGLAAIKDPSKAEGQREAAEEATGLILSRDDLKLAYRQARLLFEAVEKSDKPGNDEELQNECKKCLGFLGICEGGIRRLEVFSKNEEVGDVNTEDLYYILVNYYAGKLVLKEVPSDPSGASRLKAVQNGRKLLEAFLEQCLGLKLLDEADKKIFLSYQGNARPPNLPREVKMERFKKARDAKTRLEHVSAQLRRLKMKEEENEDLERESALLDIDCAIKSALDDIESGIQEEEILKFMAQRNLQFSKPGSTPPSPPPSEGLNVTRIDKNFNMIRETIKSQVFRPSWRQPTMSLEEYAEIEMREAMEREKREKQRQEENPDILTTKELHAQGLEDNEELLDKSTVKDRNWDDWKDGNPKGKGVTKRI